MISLTSGLALAAALGCGLIAGVFYGFSTFIVRALSLLPPAEGIAAMQSINIAVLNRWFLGPFFGTGLVCAAAAIAVVVNGPVAAAACAIAGALLYAIGTLSVTIKFNVPRNNRLARLAPQDAQSAEYWQRYIEEWTWWNHVRTAAALGAAALFCLALAA